MAKERVENCAVLDVLDLARDGRLVEGSRGKSTWWRDGKVIVILFFHAEDDYLYLDRLLTGDRTNEDLWPVELARTRTSFGAERVWFYCPICEERVRKLYLPPGRVYFACRSCHSLAYASQQTRSWSYAREMAFEKMIEKSELRAERRLTKKKGAGPSPAGTGLDLFLDLFPHDLSRSPAEEAAPGPRPRGRPKEKRSYQRQTPFLSGKRPSERHGLCMRCRDYREPRDPRPVTLANGRSARKGTCPTCGATMILIVKG